MRAGGFSYSLDVLRVITIFFYSNFKILVIKILDADPEPDPEISALTTDAGSGPALKPMQIDKTDRSRNLKDLVKSDQGKIILDPQQRSSQEHGIKKVADPECVSLVPLLPDEIPDEGGLQLSPEGRRQRRMGLSFHPFKNKNKYSLVPVLQLHSEGQSQFYLHPLKYKCNMMQQKRYIFLYFCNHPCFFCIHQVPTMPKDAG